MPDRKTYRYLVSLILRAHALTNTLAEYHAHRLSLSHLLLPSCVVLLDTTFGRFLYLHFLSVLRARAKGQQPLYTTCALLMLHVTKNQIDETLLGRHFKRLKEARLRPSTVVSMDERPIWTVRRSLSYLLVGWRDRLCVLRTQDCTQRSITARTFPSARAVLDGLPPDCPPGAVPHPGSNTGTGRVGCKWSWRRRKTARATACVIVDCP